MKNNDINLIYDKLTSTEPIVSDIVLKKFTKDYVHQCYTVYLENVFELSRDYHVHDEYEILYVINGKVLYNIIDKQYELEPGDMILIPKNTLHKIANPSSKSKRIVLSFSEEFITHYSTNKTNLLNVFNEIKSKNIHKISFKNQVKSNLEKNLKLLCDLFISEDYGDDLIYNLTFAKTMLLINKQFEKIEEDYIPNSDDVIISKIIKYIEDNYSRKILLEDIASYLSLSVSRVCHVFKERTGISILQYINKKRLIESKILLRKGLEISTICTECGFQDYTSFFRSFKKEYNMTPKEFINSQKNTN